MLIFHEGLPGSGKSYAAIKDHVVPALRKGRKVFAYIEGLEHDRIALVAGITPERCRELLFQVTREQVPVIYSVVENDAFVVIDELQNHWPTNRQRLGAEITQFITEHRHRGLDILCMGQVLNDCHTMWRNRVDQLVFFYNRDAVGKPNEYKWSVRKRGSDMKFQEVTSGVAAYDPDYFGTYASHTEGTENVDKYVDKRANVWNSTVLRKAVPIYAAVGLVALGVVIWMFKGGLVTSTAKTQETVDKRDAGAVVATAPAVPTSAPAVPVQAPVVDAKQAPVEAAEPIQPPDDVVDRLSIKYRIRLAGVISGMGKVAGWVEWRENDAGVKERFSFLELAGLGWLVMVTPDGSMVTLTKGPKRYYATGWPVADMEGRASQATLREVSGPGGKT
ncbi:MAG: zonular occludens toxin [Candidatus Accumulibacter sp.]|uniref:Zonular occludens toxin n=1 Tax=Candidatus Accumulibacter affinis TaxID=2954384 RepID=A0A935TE65_9PROT|nr:zonular occludens toxin [Candidatus Accumulibacter affinis]